MEANWRRIEETLDTLGLSTLSGVIKTWTGQRGTLTPPLSYISYCVREREWQTLLLQFPSLLEDAPVDVLFIYLLKVLLRNEFN